MTYDVYITEYLKFYGI